MALTVLNPNNPQQAFPPLNKALNEPDGLIAVGGCLSTTRLVNAYRCGIFPWYNEGEPILWWSPNPRLVLLPDNLIVSRSLSKTLRKKTFLVTFDQAFDAVINACAEPRQQQAETWISQDIMNAYNALFHLGVAHSVEAWQDGELVGGLYGVALGQVFFGESMFHRRTDASKVVFATLVEQLKRWHYQLIDCQVHSQHLASFGATMIERGEFSALLEQYCELPVHSDAWQL